MLEAKHYNHENRGSVGESPDPQLPRSKGLYTWLPHHGGQNGHVTCMLGEVEVLVLHPTSFLDRILGAVESGRYAIDSKEVKSVIEDHKGSVDGIRSLASHNPYNAVRYPLNHELPVIKIDLHEV